MITLIISMLSLCVSTSAFLSAVFFRRREQKRQVITELMKQYNSSVMSKSIFEIIKFAKQHNDFIDKYIEERNQGNWELNDNRRIISRFFLLVAIYYFNGILDRKLIRHIWSIEDLEILTKVIIPICQKLTKIDQGKNSDEKIDLIVKFVDDIKNKHGKKKNAKYYKQLLS